VFHFGQTKAWLPLGVLLLSGSATTVQAAPSLAEMVTAATARNPGIELAQAERGMADALQRKAEQPFADAPSANLKYQTDAIGSDLGYREWEGGVDLPLWLPGQSDQYAREAERGLAVSDSIGDAKRLEIAGEVRERLWAVAIARSEVAQNRSALEVAKGLLHDVQRRVEAGELPRSDRLLAEKERLLREEAVQRASIQATRAERLFNRYTGLDAPTEPVRETSPTGIALSPEHPGLRLAQRRLDQARAHRDRVSGERRRGPNLWLGGKSAKAATGTDYESSIGVELSMPFGSGAHTAPALAEAEAALTQAQVEHSGIRLALEDALTRARLELDRANAALEQTERRRTLAEESLKLSRRAFDLGETDLVRLLQAQADALSARHDYEIRQLEYGQALARLNQALGVIPQ
jgi:outer membrane protein TolC